MVHQLGITKRFLRVGKIYDKDNILAVQGKRLLIIGNNTKISPEMTPQNRKLEAIRLKDTKIRITKLI